MKVTHSLSSRAKWHAHVNGLDAPVSMRQWLNDPSSLTARLTAACREFRVQVIRQSSGRGMRDECEIIGVPKRSRVWRREVLLRCDSQAVVFARTVVPFARLTDWPRLRNLGDRSLGAALFADPRIVRGSFQFARLHAAHPVRRSMCLALGKDFPSRAILARRSEFKRNRSRLLVTEVFLPSILQLLKHESPF